MKYALEKAKSSGVDPDMALFCIHTTPIDRSIPSPPELLFDHILKGNLPVRIHNKVELQDEICMSCRKERETEETCQACSRPFSFEARTESSDTGPQNQKVGTSYSSKRVSKT